MWLLLILQNRLEDRKPKSFLEKQDRCPYQWRLKFHNKSFPPLLTTVSFCRCAKVTLRAKVMHRVVLSLCQSDPPCQSDAPCRFVAVPKWPSVSIWRPCHFVAVSFWPAPIYCTYHNSYFYLEVLSFTLKKCNISNKFFF